MERLPSFETVRAQRERMQEATRAHELLHELYSAREQLAGWTAGEALPGEACLHRAREWAAVEAALGELAPEASHGERLAAAMTALEPLGSRQHDEEHALEHLLYEQYQALMSDDGFAAQRAYLVPLYEEREALYNTLVPLAEEHGFRVAAVDLAERMTGIVSDAWAASVDEGHAEHRLEIAVQTASEVCEALRDTLPNLRLAAEVPGPSAVLVGAEQVADVEARLTAFCAAQRQAERAMGEEVEAQHDRWKLIERMIQEVTG